MTCYFLIPISDLDIDIDQPGHFVPSKGQWRRFLINYIKDPLGSYPSPAPAGDAGGDSVPASAQPSGANTPIPRHEPPLLAAGDQGKAVTLKL